MTSNIVSVVLETYGHAEGFGATVDGIEVLIKHLAEQNVAMDSPEFRKAIAGTVNEAVAKFFDVQ